MVSARSREEMTEWVGLSQRGVSDLERSVRHAPHFATLRLLAEALVLGEITNWRTGSTLLMPSGEWTEGEAHAWDRERGRQLAERGRHDEVGMPGAS